VDYSKYIPTFWRKILSPCEISGSHCWTASMKMAVFWVQAPLKRWQTYTRLDGATTQKTAVFSPEECRHLHRRENLKTHIIKRWYYWGLACVLEWYHSAFHVTSHKLFRNTSISTTVIYTRYHSMYIFLHSVAPLFSVISLCMSSQKFESSHHVTKNLLLPWRHSRPVP
jgi:hypothetical protein